MRPDELVGVADLAGEAAGGLAQQVQAVHAAVAQRVWDGLGPVAAPVRLAHDAIARGVYTGVRRSLNSTLRLGGRAATLAIPASSGSIEESPAVRTALGVLNGALGDALAERGNRLALPMTLRWGGRDLDLLSLPTGLHARPRLAIFVHGLGQTDDAWRRGETRYGERLEREHGYTSLYLRYNSGRGVRDNAQELSALLERLVSAWPVPVAEIALVGHSTGGLLVTRACHAGAESGWAQSVRQVITLGTPHTGVALERGLSGVGRLLARSAETRPLVRALEARSAGARDFGRGDRSPRLAGAAYYFISAGLLGDPGTPVERVLGDALVQRSSAWAQSSPRTPAELPPGHYRHLSGVSHFALLGHPAVYEQIRAWLSRPALPPAQRP